MWLHGVAGHVGIVANVGVVKVSDPLLVVVDDLVERAGALDPRHVGILGHLVDDDRQVAAGTLRFGVGSQGLGRRLGRRLSRRLNRRLSRRGGLGRKRAVASHVALVPVGREFPVAVRNGPRIVVGIAARLVARFVARFVVAGFADERLFLARVAASNFAAELENPGFGSPDRSIVLLD
jgi:hypothetical protein